MIRSRRSRAFTLIELLIVIAIIAVLIALAVVGLADARRAARTLQCQIQLRQVGAALQSMRDRDGQLPSMRPPAQPRSKRTAIDMHLEFMQRWYVAAGTTLTPSTDTRRTSADWSLWEAPAPWRCPQDDPMNQIGSAWIESLGYDPRWPLAAQVGTSYDYIGTSPSLAPLIRGKADEAGMRRVLTQASALYLLPPLLTDAVPFHQRARGHAKASDTNGYFQDGSVTAMTRFPGDDQTVAFSNYVQKQFLKE